MNNEIDKQENNKKRGRGNPRWKKGESGNSKGRPKKEYCIPDILRKLANDFSKYDPEGKSTRLQKICLKAIEQAEGGDKDARAWVADRMEGKAIDRIIQKNDDDDLILL